MGERHLGHSAAVAVGISTGANDEILRHAIRPYAVTRNFQPRRPSCASDLTQVAPHAGDKGASEECKGITAGGPACLSPAEILGLVSGTYPAKRSPNHFVLGRCHRILRRPFVDCISRADKRRSQNPHWQLDGRVCRVGFWAV